MWREVPLGEVIALQRGIDTTRATQRPGRVPVISSGGISSFRADAWTSGPGVVMGRKGTLGRVFYVDEPYWPHDTTLWVTDFKGNAPRFIYYLLQRIDVAAMDVGSASPTLNRNHLYPLEVTIPSVAEQEAIAEVLGALDDKIAANNAAAERADELVRAMYQHLVQGELQLRDICSNPRANVLPGGEVVPYVGLEHLPRRHLWLGELGASSEVTSAKTEFAAGDTLFGKLRPYFHKVVSAPVEGVCSTDILVLRPREVQMAGLVLAAAASDETVNEMAAKSAGTKMPRANWQDLSACKIRGADDLGTREFSRRVMAIRDAVEMSSHESRTLAQLRDTLLPALMDGTLRVKDAVAQVEEVL